MTACNHLYLCGFELYADGKCPRGHTGSDTPIGLAKQAIGAFLEYRDQHGWTEPDAKDAAALEVAQGVAATGEIEPRFVQFTEFNDHEGETWHFWLQLDGNEHELDKFRHLLTETAYGLHEEVLEDLGYVLTKNVEPESVIDLLVRYGADEAGRYMAQHHKITGVFTCPVSLGENAEHLYKGRIRQHFAAAGKAGAA
jgi:hypothetical protein